MNWWANLTQFFGLAIFAILFSCEQESLLNIKGDGNSPLKVSYKTIPISSTVFATDSLPTDRVSTALTNRLLVGRYVDDKFGIITSSAYTEFRPSNAPLKIAENAIILSAQLILTFDYYQYGLSTTSTNEFNIHRMKDSLRSQRTYFFNDKVDYYPTPLGIGSYRINPESFKISYDKINNANQTVERSELDSVIINIDKGFAGELLTMAKDNRDDYIDYKKFRKQFPGLVIVPGSGDEKIVGLSPKNDINVLAVSTLVINYSELDDNGDRITKMLTFDLHSINGGIHRGFNNITADRTGVPLGAINRVHTEFDINGERYYQSGDPIVTKFDFNNFIEFAKPFPYLLLNYVKMVVKVDDSPYEPPTILRLRLLDDHNEFISIYDRNDQGGIIPIYPSSMTYGHRGWYIIGRRISSTLSNQTLCLQYDEEKGEYSGDFTTFFQDLVNQDDITHLYKYFALVASNPWIGESVNRVSFKASEVTLEVFYTVPTEE